MKKELLIASIFAATVAGAGSIDTSNVMGYLPVDAAQAKASGMLLVTVPFRAYGSTGASDAPIRVADIIQTAGLNAGDKLYIPDGSGAYNAYTLSNDKKSWTADTKVTINSDGSTTAASGTSATDATLARGQAFWVKTSATAVNLMGEGTTNSATVTATGGSDKLKWNLVGSPSVSTGIALASLGGAKGDTILLANGTQYTCDKNGAWHKWNGTTLVTTATEDKIPAGVGFWYATKTTKTF